MSIAFISRADWKFPNSMFFYLKMQIHQKQNMLHKMCQFGRKNILKKKGGELSKQQIWKITFQRFWTGTL